MSTTIERIRAEEQDRAAEKRLTVDEIGEVISGLKTCDHLDEVSRASGLDTDEVLAVVAEFGTWLTHVHGGADVETIEWWETGLLWPANDSDDHVVIPAGFERDADHGRDVAKSLRAIVVGDPGNEEIARWLSRKYPSDTAVLTFPMVASVWKFAQLDRLDGIDQVSPHSAFRRIVVEAYDLLNVAVTAAQQGVRTMARLSRATRDEVAAELLPLRDAATAASWWQPGDTTNLIRLVDAAIDDPRNTSAVVSRLRTLGRLMANDPGAWFPEGIASLNQGHVEQIALLGGLSVEGVTRAEETDIRNRLAEMGLKSDADRLVPEGVRALLSGVEDTFWEAMELRANGDESWHEVLAGAYG